MAAIISGLEGRLADIDRFYANNLNNMSVSVGSITHLLPGSTLKQAAQRLVEESQGSRNKAWLGSQPTDIGDFAGQVLFKGVRTGGARTSLEETTFQRTLVSMSEPERASLRLADILKELGELSQDDYLRAVVPVIWNGGNTLIEVGGKHGQNFRGTSAANQILKDLLGSSFGDSAAGRERVQAALRSVLERKSELSEQVRSVLERYLFAGARWMSESEAHTAALKNPDSPSVLRLGTISGSESELLYDWNESLITVAAPGTGKSQAHVLRNLLHLKAPAVVLDIKGEMRDGSAAWRSEHVGPVFTFDPKQPAQSLHYNPLDVVSNDPEQGWDEARRLADLLVVPPSASRRDEYWESRGRDLITAAVFDVALSEEGDHRSMNGVLDRLYLPPGDKLDQWFEHLEKLEAQQLRRTANALKGMPAEQREGIFDSARRQLEIWQSPAITRLTKSSTFSASVLRESSATLYLCVSLDDIKKFASVLRVIIGQTLHVLFRAKPESGTLPVTFFLDEMARLGHMDVIEEALDAGRSYGVRLWMFCQNTGQLSSAYRNADGMTGNCAARCYMNPDEDTARWMSQNLGMREGLLDGHRKPLAEPSQLTGPEFASQIVVFLRGHPPARLDKRPAWADPVCKKRMAGEPEPAAPQAPPPASPAPAIVAPVAAPAALAAPAAPAASAASAAPPAQQSDIVVSVEPARAELVQPAEVPADEVIAANAAPLRSTTTDWRRWAAPAAISAAALAWSVFTYLHLDATRASEAAAIKARDEARSALQAAEATARAAQSEMTSDRNRLGAQISSLQQQLSQTQGIAEAHRQDAARARQDLASLTASIQERQRVVPQQATPVLAPPPATVPAPAPAEQINAFQLAERNACDQLAGNRYDPDWPGQFPGASFGDLRANASQAIAACERATASLPNEPRMKYQLARAYQAANQNDRAFSLLTELSRNGYAAAYDNLGSLYMRQQQVRIAVDLHRKGADAGDPEAMVTVASLIEKGTVQPRHANEFWDLLNRAAQAGHEGARKTLAERQAAGAVIQQIPGFIRNFIGR